MPIWSNSQINAKLQEAETELARETDCIIDRIAPTVSAQNAVVELPDSVQGVRRATWLGVALFPITMEEAINRFPTLKPQEEGAFEPEAYADPFTLLADRFPVGKPRYFIFDSIGLNRIALYPSPDISMTEKTSGLWDDEISSSFILECSFNPDFSQKRVPEYVRMSTCKPYALSQLFSFEGRGQDLEAAEYWKTRWDAQLYIAKSILTSVYAINNSQLLNSIPKILARPQLPANYGTIVR